MLRSEFVGPQVGKELALNGLYAVLFVVVGFLIYISFRFEWKFAVAATITTMHDVVVVAGWFAISGHEFDLTVLAGMLSVMGFSINDTIVVFDRVRENFRGMRASPVEILNKSINQTLSRTMITSFVAFLTVLALYLYGGGSLEGMAESQMIGIVDRHAVVDLRGLSAADHVGAEGHQAGPDAEGEGRGGAGAPALKPASAHNEKGRAMRGLFLGRFFVGAALAASSSTHRNAGRARG